MKNVYLYIVFLLMGFNSFAQNGVDVVFLVDNSNSISNTYFSQIQTSVTKLMTEVIACNPKNKVTVAQYSLNGASNLFISSNFGTTSYGFTRAYQGQTIGGNVAYSMSTLTQALNGTPSLAITSPQKVLTRTPGNSLVVYIFTNAERPYDLIAGPGTVLGQDASFSYYTNFKQTFGATIMVSLVADVDPTAIPAAASVASKGGSYNGSIEGYPSDPDGQGTLPRYLSVKSNFTLSNAEIQKISNDICWVSRINDGADVIFLVDNSNSISNTYFSQIQTSVTKLMTEVMTCNPKNRVTVAQYSLNGASNLFISSNFGTTSYGFTRAYQGQTIGGNVAYSMTTLTQALNGTPSAAITSPQKVLTRTPGNSLVVYIFTNAERSYDLIAGPGTVLGQDTSFRYYTDFKQTFAATLMVSLVADVDPTAIPAAASVASKGGSYNGGIEGYPSDPDGQGILPRYLLVKSNFALSTTEIQNIAEGICSVSMPHCVDNLVLKSPENNVQVGLQDNRQAQNLIVASNVITSNGGVAIYHSNDTVLLTSGFYSQAGSRFRGYIQPCTDQFVGLRASEEDEDLNFSMTEVKQSLFTLSPNPAADRTVIASDKMMAHVEVKSLTGTIFYSGKVNDKSHELYIGNYPKGFYMVMVTTDTGEVEVKKLIKD